MEKRHFLILVLFGIIFKSNKASNETISGYNYEPQHKKLVRDLMSKYGSKSSRPLLNSSDPITIRFYFQPSILSEFKEQNQRLSVVGVLYMGWVDELLQWNPDDYGGVDRISLARNDIWIPDITADERLDVGQAFVNVFEPYIIVNSTGHVTYFDLSDLTVYCRLNMTRFPFDTQRCKISFLSFSYDNSQLILSYANTSSANFNRFAPNGVWILTDVSVEEVDVYYLCCPKPYVEVHYELFLERIGNFYIYSIWVPSGLLSFLIIAVFVMHPNSGEKVSLSVNNVLAFILFQQIVAESMPRSGDDSPIIVAYFSVMIAISCVSVLLSALVLRVYHHNPRIPVPWPLHFLVRKRIKGNSSSSLHSATKIFPRDSHHNDEYPNQQCTEDGGPHPVTIETIYDPKKDYEPKKGLTKRKETKDVNVIKDNLINQRFISSNPKNVESVSQGLQHERYHRDEYRKETDWMILALMLDKFFLALAIVSLFVTLLYILIRFKFDF